MPVFGVFGGGMESLRPRHMDGRGDVGPAFPHHYLIRPSYMGDSFKHIRMSEPYRNEQSAVADTRFLESARRIRRGSGDGIGSSIVRVLLSSKTVVKSNGLAPLLAADSISSGSSVIMPLHRGNLPYIFKSSGQRFTHAGAHFRLAWCIP